MAFRLYIRDPANNQSAYFSRVQEISARLDPRTSLNFNSFAKCREVLLNVGKLCLGSVDKERKT